MASESYPHSRSKRSRVYLEFDGFGRVQDDSLRIWTGFCTLPRRSRWRTANER